MDADLYDHLSTTITNGPHQQHAGEDPETGNVSTKDPAEVQERSDPESATTSNDTTRRQRTMSSSLPEEIDQVVHAISSSQWAARLGTLMGSVKKQVLHSVALLLMTLQRANLYLRRLEKKQARNLRTFDLDLLRSPHLTALQQRKGTLDWKTSTQL